MFLQQALIGCFVKSVKQTKTFFIITFIKEMLRRDVFPSRTNIYMENIVHVYTGIPSWTSRIPPSPNELKNVPASYKRKYKCVKK